MSKVHEYTVLSNKLTTPSTFIVTLYNHTRQQPMLFEPGQYAAISFPGKNNRPTPARCFSVASSPTEQGFLQFGLKVGGSYTKTALNMLVPGTKAIVEGPFGSFTYDPERDRSAMFLAGGIGVTPFLSMIRYATRLQLDNQIALVYSCRSQDEIPFLDELLGLRKLNPHFGIMFVIGSGPIDRLAGEYVTNGHIDGPLFDYLVAKSYESRSYFICGPTGFMKSVSATLLEKGAMAESVMTEAFSQGQISHRSLSHNVSLQVYTLTGLSLVLSTGSVTAAAVAKAVQSDAQNNTAQNQTANAPANSRQAIIDQTITNLQTSNQNQVPTPTPSPSSATPSPTPQPSPGPNPTPSPSPTPSPAPSPSPSPTPTPPPPSPSPTPSPTPPPPPPAVAPKLSFYASQYNIKNGQSTTLYWSINQDATPPVACGAAGAWSGSKSTSGSQSVNPGSTTTYKLQCSNSAGSSSGSVTITVCTSTPSKPC